MSLDKDFKENKVFLELSVLEDYVWDVAIMLLDKDFKENKDLFS